VDGLEVSLRGLVLGNLGVVEVEDGDRLVLFGMSDLEVAMLVSANSISGFL